MKNFVRATCGRVGAWASMVAPVGVVAAVMMPLARSGERFGTVCRLIALWRQRHYDGHFDAY